MYCKYCGRQIDSNSKFCNFCGKNLLNKDETKTKYYKRIGKSNIVKKLEKHKLTKKRQNDNRITFFKSVKNYYLNYFNFSGRAVRAEYWWAQLYLVIAELIFILIAISVGVILSLFGIKINVQPVITLFLLRAIHYIPTLSLTIRRLHDTCKSGYYYFVRFIPLVGEIMFIITMCERSGCSNEWGETSNNSYASIIKNCSDECHQHYVREITKIGVDTDNGKWISSTLFGENIFVCNHCNLVIAYENDFKKEIESSF